MLTCSLCLIKVSGWLWSLTCCFLFIYLQICDFEPTTTLPIDISGWRPGASSRVAKLFIVVLNYLFSLHLQTRNFDPITTIQIAFFGFWPEASARVAKLFIVVLNLLFSLHLQDCNFGPITALWYHCSHDIRPLPDLPSCLLWSLTYFFHYSYNPVTLIQWLLSR